MNETNQVREKGKIEKSIMPYRRVTSSTPALSDRNPSMRAHATVRLNFSLPHYAWYIKMRKPKLGFGLREISPDPSVIRVIMEPTDLLCNGGMHAISNGCNSLHKA